MGYDIPQEIKYKEIIAFGLTLKQLIVAVITIAITGYVLLPNLYDPLRIIISLFLLSSGFGLMFLQLEKHALSLIQFFCFREAENKDKVMKKYLGIKKLGRNSLELENNTVLSFLEVEPVDTSLSSDLQKESFAFQFQKFLNSLDFPIQIITTTNTEKVFRKKFFVVIPKRFDLSIQTSLVKDKLKDCGLKLKLLKDYEIIQLFNNFFKNCTENVSIKELRENYAHHIIAPEKIINKPDYLIQENTYSRIISIVGYPRSVNFGFLKKIIKMQEKVDISIHIEPFSIEKLTVKLNYELQKQASDLHSIRRKGGNNPILEIKHSDTMRVMEELQKGEEKLFLVSLYVHCKAENFTNLNKLTEKVKNELNSLLIIPKIPKFTQAQALKSCLPLCDNVLQEQRNITSKPLSAFFPFTTRFYTQDETGIEYGKNSVNQPIKKDIFKLANHNGVILASSGGGKSYLTKLLVQRYSNLDNQKVFVIDPEGEYTNLVKKLGGQVITIGIGSKNNINIFDSFGQNLALKKIKLHEIFYMLFPDLGELQRSYLDQGINEIYKKNETPFIGKLYYDLLKRKEKAKDAVDMRVLSGLIYRLAMFVTGGFNFMNQKTNISLEKNLVCFYLKDLPLFLRPAIMYLVMDYLYVQMRAFKGNKLVFVDEAWSLLSKTKEDTYLFKLIKTCRKYKLGIFLITQEVEDLLNEPTGRSVLANSSTAILLRQKQSVITKICEVFQLNYEEKLRLLNAQIGQGIAIFDNERHIIKAISTKQEHETIEEQTTPEITEENPYPELNLEKPYYKQNQLSNEQINHLLNNEYISTYCTPINQIRSSKYLVKKNKRESPQHYFIVHNITEEIKKYTDKVETYETVKPDIIFEYKSKQYAIEVETGKNLESHKKRIIEKAKQNNKDFGKNWFFLITNQKYSYFYEELGKTHTIQQFRPLLLQIFENNKPTNNGEKIRSETPNITSETENFGN